ncbi:hypothetical protein PIB30_030309 [Stylosanthes scabra]|uniref:CNH domain-containing protein n=1 Tax=Stylosanthes scabra TaxID=79078 RepID=A0ABU6SC50_9FABA|nr:hypothetical protein [Stylosanthes scabra]
MAKPALTTTTTTTMTRTVLEPFSHFDLSSHSRKTTIRSLALATSPSDPQHAFLYVGTYSGTLFSLSTILTNSASSNASDHSNHNAASAESTFLHKLKFQRSVSVGDSPVESIFVLAELGKILILSEGSLFLVDSELTNHATRLSFPKGVSVVARRVRSGGGESEGASEQASSSSGSGGQRFLKRLGSGVRVNGLRVSKEGDAQGEGNSVFAIVAGKRLLLAELVLSGGVSGSLAILKEIQFVDGVISTMVWLDDSIIVGTANGYSLISSVTGQSGVIFSLPDVSRPPRLKLLRKEWRVLLLVDNVGIIVDPHGQPVGGSLVFRHGLDSVGEISSYVVIVSDGKIELYHKRNGSCVQVLPFGGEGIGPCIVASEEDRGGKLVAVATATKVVCYQKLRSEEQIKDLLRKKNYKEAVSLVEELEAEEVQTGFCRFLGIGVETIVDNDLFLNPPNRADLLESAIKNISRYLEACREKDLTQSVREGVDTLLMYLYRALNRVEDMERLASSTNWCVVEELEQMLEESGHLRTLAFLCASKGMSSKAVSIWRILARNYSSGLWKDTALNNNIPYSRENLVSGKGIAAAEAAKILEESSEQDLILQHLGWIAEISQVLAVKVLTSDRRVVQLNPDEVVTAIDPQKVEILQRYLQWLIEDQDCSDTQLHTLYALSLAKSAIEEFESENLDTGNTESTSGSSIFQTTARKRLQVFLQSSDLYDPEEVLDLIEGSELWLEKAILYRRLGQETLVLQILALKLEDSEAAEQYCAEIGRADAYMQLLEMYLDPQDGKEPMFNAAVRLLHNHGESLDPLQVLEKLSPDMPLQLASETLLRMFRARVHHHLQGQIVHNLSRAVDIDARLSRLEERSRHVQINDESLCDSCDARLGTKLFAMYPDDTVVCYKCYRRQGESVSVSGRNFKEDILIKPGWLVSR